MRTLPFVFLLLMGITWRCVQSTCVLETDFGLSINCGLKKSGMFRVRNLGGLKGYVGLGIQLADELGFKESLSSLEQNSKRRSVNGFAAPGSFEPLAALGQDGGSRSSATTQANNDRSAYAKMNGRTISPVPPFRPLIAAANAMVRNVRLATQQQQQQQQQQPMTAVAAASPVLLKPLPVPAFAALPESIAKVAVESPTKKPAGPVLGRPSQQPTAPAAFVVPIAAYTQHQMPSIPTTASRQQPTAHASPQQPSPVYYQNALQQAANRRYNAFAQSPQNAAEPRPIVVMPVATAKKQPAEKSPLSNEVDPGSTTSLLNVAAANNVSVEQLALALRQHQQQQRLSLVAPYYAPRPEVTAAPASTTATATTTTTTTTSTTTAAAPYFQPEELSVPVTKKSIVKPYRSKYATGLKVMNAPKEYYPMSYEKNFDDNFVSKVDLPDTTFQCGEQKHFPGLYGDEDLGCMVFHVCAFTDDGLTQKSFLCPESTLFDQTILKCNWWFYVDCKSSKKLYDSNIPISKSYQLMKALTFFSSYSSGPGNVDDTLAAAMGAGSSTTSGPVTSGLATSGPLEQQHQSNNATEVLDNVSFRR